MRIVHINTFDYVNGASRAAYRLHDGLRRLGQDSGMYVLSKVTNDLAVKSYKQRNDFMSKLVRTVRRLHLRHATLRYDKTAPPNRTFFSDDRTIYKDACEQIPKSDLIQLHWVTDFIDFKKFFAWLPSDMPLVWTLHDMANFTGGCCNDIGCGKFIQECGACPQLGSLNQLDLSRQVWQRKRGYYAALNRDQVHVVTPSRWLAEEVKRSPLLARFHRSVIPYALDTEIFQPRNRSVAREVLGIPQDAPVVLFVSSDVNSHLKGSQFLTQALAGIDDRSKLFLLSVGQGTSANFQKLRHAHFQNVQNDRLLSFIYSAADVFVAPSLGDNLPNTVLESIACGTPAIAFSIGGMPDLIRPGVTGLLATPGDSADLRAAIVRLLGDNDMRAEMSAHCRQVAIAEYDLSVQARRYLKLYEEMLGRKTNSN
jgi:glycosyltransferase involved in cell wall biosynthesis